MPVLFSLPLSTSLHRPHALRRPPWLAMLAMLAALQAAPPATAAAVALPADLASWTCAGICGSSAADGDLTLSPLGQPRYGFLTTAGSDALGLSPLQLDANSRGSGTETNGARTVSPVFHAAAGDQLALQFNYLSTDGKGFDDYAWARLLDATDNRLVAWLFTARSSNSSTRNIVPGDVVDKRDFDPDAVIVDYDSFDFHSKTAADPVRWSPLGASDGSCWRDNAAGCGYTGWLQSVHAFGQSGDYRVEIGIVNWGDNAYDSGLAFDYAGLSAPVPEPGRWALTLAALGGLGLVAWRRRSPGR